MRQVSAQLIAAINAGSTKLCHIYTFERKDATTFRFTDLDHDLIIGGFFWLANHSVNISNVSSAANDGIQSADLKVLFEDSNISEIDLVRHKWDGAEVEIAICDYTHPEWGRIILLTGKLGSIEITNKRYGNIEVRGMLSRSDQRIGEYYSAMCRADLGDARCKVILADFTYTGTVTLPINSTKFNCSLSEAVAAGHLSFGVLSWTSGQNDLMSMEVLSQGPTGGGEQIIMALSMPYAVTIGDTFSIVAGCDKLRPTCITKFDNIENMRAEPFVPGDDVVTDRPLNDSV